MKGYKTKATVQYTGIHIKTRVWKKSHYEVSAALSLIVLSLFINLTNIRVISFKGKYQEIEYTFFIKLVFCKWFTVHRLQILFKIVII